MRLKTFANLVSTCFVLMTLAVCFISAAWMSGRVEVPEALAPATAIDVPTAVAMSLFTPSHTPTASVTPQPTHTFTPSPTWSATPTQTATATSTPTITNTPSRTPTWTPSSTASPSSTATDRPTDTPTATFTAAPPTATVAPFPFEIPARGGLQPRSELSGSCAFSGFGGTVLDLNGQQLTGLQIVVRGPSLPVSGSVSTSGSSTKYGASGWEVQVAQTTVVNSYTIQLRDLNGTPLSAPITHTFSGDCLENLLLIRFQQVREY